MEEYNKVELSPEFQKAADMTMDLYKFSKERKKPSYVPEAKSLMWLSNMFPEIKCPENDVQRMNNCIHAYTKAGAQKIRTMEVYIDWLEGKLSSCYKKPLTEEDVNQMAEQTKLIYNY